MSCVINVPGQETIDAINDDTNFNQQETNENIRHTELMCTLDEINKNLKNLLVCMSIIIDQEINLDD